MLKPGQALILVVIALLTFGVVMVNSAGLRVTTDNAIDWQSVIFSRATIYAIIALGMLLVGSCIPSHMLVSGVGWRSPIPWLVVIMIFGLLAVHLPGLERNVNGSSRWINIAGLSIQPSEFAKWGILIVLAWYGYKRAGSMHKLGSGFLPAMWLIAVICCLIAVEDLGTAVLVGLVGVAVLISAGSKLWHAALVLPLGVVGFVAAVIHNPYRINRLLAYLDPYQDSQGIGYHIIQSMAAVSGGGLTGRGLGNGVRKFGYLPEDTTDFIFAIICEELGVFGASLVMFLYGALILCGYLIIRQLTHPFQRLLATGIVLMVSMQAVINIAVVTGVAPTKGIALPLLSKGGTGWVLTAFSIGLLVAMDRYKPMQLPSIGLPMRTVDNLNKDKDDPELSNKTPRVPSISPAG